MSSKSGELKLFDNKQLIHIASEVVVLIGLTFYFSSKNKKLLGHVEELAQRLEEQEDHIQKLEASLQQMSQKIDSSVQQMNTGFMQIGQSLQQTNANVSGLSDMVSKEEQPPLKKHVKKMKQPANETEKPVNKPVPVPQQIPKQNPKSQPIPIPPRHTSPVLTEVSEQPRQPTKVQFTDPPRISKPIMEDEDEDLDDELEEELDDSDLDEEIRAELDELIEDDSGLKKET